MSSNLKSGLGLVLLVVTVYLLSPELRTLTSEAVSILSSNDIERARRWVAQFSVWGPVVILLFMLLQTLIPVLPSVGVMVISTLAYGPFWGGLLAWSGLMLAAMLGYAMGRFLGEATLQRFVTEKSLQAMRNLMERYGLWAVVAARISPLISTDAVSLAAGVGQMRFAPFMLATALGTLPLTIIISLLAEDFERMALGLTVISVVTLLGMGLYIWQDQRKSRS